MFTSKNLRVAVYFPVRFLYTIEFEDNVLWTAVIIMRFLEMVVIWN